MSFTAAYLGECADCGGQLIGREVEYDTNDDLIHVTCPPEALTLARPACPHCFIELPASGVCGDCE